MARFMQIPQPKRRKLYKLKLDPTEEFEDGDFYDRFRFNKPIFREIVDMVKPALLRKDTRGGALSVECQVAAALRYYATGSFQQVVGDTNGFSQTSMSDCITAVSTAIDNCMDDHIYFPTDPTELMTIKRGFKELAGFPNVIGAIDGTHIPVKRQPEYDNQYWNRKGYRSLNVQCCCDHNGVFTNAFVKYPGSCHDSYILQNSNLWDYCEANPEMGIILGDSAYPLKPWLMTPLRNPSNRSEIAYNSAQAKSRVVIENAFGRLKRRFAVLSIPNRRKDISNVAKDIRACLVLHNIATRNRLADFFGPDQQFGAIEGDEENGDPQRQRAFVTSGQIRRSQLIQNVFNH